jgi:hypothetical protein
MDRYLRVEALVSVRHTTVSMTNPTDRIEIITSVRRRWTASEKVRMVEEKGKVVFRHACLMGLEGIVSKRLGSKYRSGRSSDWLKFKNPEAPAVKREAEPAAANPITAAAPRTNAIGLIFCS